MNRRTRVSTIAVVSTLTLMTGSASAASPASTTATDRCAAVHMVLVNGTFDTAPGVDPTADHGFYAQVATTAMERANDGTPPDKSAGIQAPVVEGLEPTAVAETITAQQSQWGDSAGVGADLPSVGAAAWGPQTTPATATPTSPVGEDLWTVTTTEPDVVEGEEVAAPTTSLASQWPSEATKEEQADENVQRIARTYVTYPATAGGAYVPGVHQPPTADSTSYADSMATGVDNAKAVLDQIEQECPDTKVFISGYSQGAQVASTVLRDIGAGEGPVNPQMVAGGALMSDPTRVESAPLILGGTATPAPAPGTRGIAMRQLGPVGSEEIVPGGGIAIDRSAGGQGFGALNGRVASYCLPGDLVCAMPVQSPLPKLVTSVAEEVNLNDPVGSLRAIADTLGPAVVLGGVESLSEGVSFGNGGFQISRASNPNATLLGRIATETARADRKSGEMEQRLVAGITKIGGMALGAGITVAREVVTPANIAQIAAAGIAGPQAAGAVAIAKLAESSMKLITPDLMGGASRRVMDEVQAAGLNEETLTTVATQAAQWNAQNAHAGYASIPVTPDGRTAAEATADWAVALAADAVAGTDRQLPSERVSPTLGTARPVEFDQESATNALSQLLEVAQKS